MITLNKGCEDIYAFLSFSGVDLSMEEYIKKYPSREAMIREKFSLVDAAVEKVEAFGLKLKPGTVPYKGFRTTA